jgi:NAD-dependent SIR2 family protein deacetylase
MPTSTLVNRNLDIAAGWLEEADALLIAAGAGMGVDSGLPDFRGNRGLWQAYPALQRSGLDFTTIATPTTFATNPRLAWGFYGHRLGLYRSVRPHPGFRVLAKLSPRYQFGSYVFTSNVDGQFQAAGFPELRLHECHGSIHWLQCTTPCSQELWSAEHLEPKVDETTCAWLGPFPSCPNCGALARPNILMFGDGNWVSRRTDAQALRTADWLTKVHRLVVLELGAGTQVGTIRRVTEELTTRRNARLVRINPRDFEIESPNATSIPLGAFDGLMALNERLSRPMQE